MEPKRRDPKKGNQKKGPERKKTIFIDGHEFIDGPSMNINDGFLLMNIIDGVHQ